MPGAASGHSLVEASNSFVASPPIAQDLDHLAIITGLAVVNDTAIFKDRVFGGLIVARGDEPVVVLGGNPD